MSRRQRFRRNHAQGSVPTGSLARFPRTRSARQFHHLWHGLQRFGKNSEKVVELFGAHADQKVLRQHILRCSRGRLTNEIGARGPREAGSTVDNGNISFRPSHRQAIFFHVVRCELW